MRPRHCDAFNIKHGMEQTSMTNAIKKRLDRKGFTLAEVLVTVAIILILAGVTFVSVAQYQKNLRLMEMDGTAKEIFIAAQNHLSVAQASGDLDRLAEKAKSATDTTDSTIGTKLDPSLVSAYAGDTTSGEYYYVIHNVTSGIESCTPSGSGAILQMMLPFGALDETVATGGNYAIVYELKSASVVAVLYSGAGNASFGNAAVITLDDEDVKNIEAKNLYQDKSARKSYEKNGVTAIVGCYTGTAGSAAIPTETLEAPKLEVKNENKLHVIVSDTDKTAGTDNVTLIIRGVQSGTVAQRILERSTSDGHTCTGTFDVTLDDITGDDGSYRFANIISSGRFTATTGIAFIPGENIEISARVSSTTGLATPKESAKYTVSSLFGDVNETKDAGNTTVYIKNLRHLENLGANVSGFTAALGNGTTSGSSKVVNITAEQKNDITMFSMSTSGSAGGNHFENLRGSAIYGMGQEATFAAIDVNYPLVYHGNQHEIHDVSIGGQIDHTAAGIFGRVADPTSGAANASLSVSDLILRNNRVSGTKVQNAGMLVGETAKNLTVDGVLAYYHEDTYDETKDSSVEVTASENAGGLIGLVSGGKLDVKNSAAAVYVKGGSAAGGFIGSVSGASADSTIVQSYAGGHTRDGAYSTTDATTNKPVLEGPGRYNVQASGYAGGFIGVTTNKVLMNAVYSTASAYSVDATKSGSFSGNTETNFGTAKNYYAIGPHNGTDASADDTAKSEIPTGQMRRQATAYDRTLMGATDSAAHPAMDKTSYPLNTIRHFCATSVDNKELPWFIKEHVGDWVVSKKTEEPNFEIDNGNRLIVRIDTGLEGIAEDIYYELKVHGHSSQKDAYFLIHVDDTPNVTVGRGVYNGEITEDWKIDKWMNSICELLDISHGTYNTKGLEICLDDITTNEGRFLDVCSDVLWPGEDITVYVSPVEVKVINEKNYYSATFEEDKGIDTNSIFGYLESAQKTSDLHNEQKVQAVEKHNPEARTTTKGMGLISMGNGTYYAQIDNSRHLQNLSSDISYQIKPFQINITGAIQTDNIYWSGENHPNSYTQSITKELGTDFEIWGQNKKYTINSNFRPIVDNNPIYFYDGSGYKISGIKVDINEAAGLFGELSQMITVENLTMESTSVISNTSEAGGLIGYAKGNTTIENVIFAGKLQVQGKKCTGGFIGQTDNNVDVSESGIECDATIISKNDDAGGLIGYINGHDTTAGNVKVVGKNTEIIATENAGGLIGHIVTCPKLNISNVGVSAFITSYNNEDQAGSGGLIGRIGQLGSDSKIEKSYYGGRTSKGNYDSCTVNEGTENERSYGANINGKKSTGGFIGYIGTANGLLIDSCFSTGSVNAESKAAGGFIGSPLDWGGSITIKNCYSFGKVSGTNALTKGGFIGKLNGNISFENVFYYSAFNAFKDVVGNQPGFQGITVIDDPNDILADENLETVNTYVYDTPTLEVETYPYKNWTTDHDDTALTMVPTYYGDWPKDPIVQSYLAYYECYENGIGIYVPDKVNTLSVKAPTGYLNGQQKTGYGILVNTKNKNEVKKLYSIVGGGTLSKISSKVNDTEFNTIQVDNTAFYLWRFTDDSMNELQWDKKVDRACVSIKNNDGIIYDVNGNYGAAIAPQGKLGTDDYPFRIRNTNYHYNRYSNDRSNASYRGLKFVDERG